jgi:hypothetical protein
MIAFKKKKNITIKDASEVDAVASDLVKFQNFLYHYFYNLERNIKI